VVPTTSLAAVKAYYAAKEAECDFEGSDASGDEDGDEDSD